jgi:pyridoxine 5-phosphate synthase
MKHEESIVSGVLLGVNIDHVATLRQARGTPYPDPVEAALVCESAGADGITLHLREDRRHIQDDDVVRLIGASQTRVNLEMAATDEMVAIACRLRPAHCCLVPEKRAELTTEGGLDVVGNLVHLTRQCARLRDAGIDVSLFIDAEPAQIEASVVCGATTIELHTGHYADTAGLVQKDELMRIARGLKLGQEEGLTVNAGHGLHYQNTRDVVMLGSFHELNIGHSIISQAVFCGLDQAVRDMKAVISSAC